MLLHCGIWGVVIKWALQFPGCNISIYFYKEIGVDGLMQKFMIGLSPPPHTPAPFPWRLQSKWVDGATPSPFPLRAPLKVSGWWGMVNIMELRKPEIYPPLNPPPPKLKRKKCKAHSVCPWAFTLAAWNFFSQNFLSGLIFTPHKSNFFLLNLIGPGKKNWNYEGSPKLKILWTDGVPPPFAHRYI